MEQQQLAFPIVQPLNYATASLTGYILLAPLERSCHAEMVISVPNLCFLSEENTNAGFHIDSAELWTLIQNSVEHATGSRSYWDSALPRVFELPSWAKRRNTSL
jgi:hypothetical protein